MKWTNWHGSIWRDMSFWLLILICLILFQNWWVADEAVVRGNSVIFRASFVGSGSLALALPLIQVRKSGQPFLWWNAYWIGVILCFFSRLSFSVRRPNQAMEES